MILYPLILSFCRGCKIECCDADFNFGCAVIAIDWDPTALHLRYQTSLERVCTLFTTHIITLFSNKYNCIINVKK